VHRQVDLGQPRGGFQSIALRKNKESESMELTGLIRVVGRDDHAPLIRLQAVAHLPRQSIESKAMDLTATATATATATRQAWRP